jgi:hypothetical protein
MTAVIFIVAAADGVTGTYLLVTAWQRRRPRRSSRLVPPASTPLADEIEDCCCGGRVPSMAVEVVWP